MSLRFHDTLKQIKQFFVTLHKLFKNPFGGLNILFNRYFGLTKYHIYEESTSYSIIKKKRNKEKKVLKMSFSSKLKAVIQSPSEQNPA